MLISNPCRSFSPDGAGGRAEFCERAQKDVAAAYGNMYARALRRSGRGLHAHAKAQSREKCPKRKAACIRDRQLHHLIKEQKNSLRGLGVFACAFSPLAPPNPHPQGVASALSLPDRVKGQNSAGAVIQEESL
ncbi:MAG: hypothetical protein D6813_04095 [Calditrichaeota bacterium]|nr:MAG: hypothetical protein D6813_04095 [Calditrichota bacterium]